MTYYVTYYIYINNCLIVIFETVVLVNYTVKVIHIYTLITIFSYSNKPHLLIICFLNISYL